MAGMFITLEGIDGSGKTTLLQLMTDHLQALGHTVLPTREPGGSMAGARLRALLLESVFGTVDDRAEALLYAADRAFHGAEVIRPALQRGEIVISDRYIDSGLAYQGGGRGLSLEMLLQINSFAVNGLMPDITFWLDLPVETALARLCGERDRLEQENIDFFRRTAAVYQQLAMTQPQRFLRIDAVQAPQMVLMEIMRVLGPRLG